VSQEKEGTTAGNWSSVFLEKLRATWFIKKQDSQGICIAGNRQRYVRPNTTKCLELGMGTIFRCSKAAVFLGGNGDHFIQ
jgi:hypothetical protein